MSYVSTQTQDERKRLLEGVCVFVTTAVLLLLSQLETRLFSLSETLSENREFFTTIAYFALININVVLILFLSFLIFRHVIRLIVDRKRGVLGAKLRTKLVFSLVFFALAPTLLLFYVSMKFVTTSFDAWFSERVKFAMQETRDASSLLYQRDKKRLQSLARLALEKVAVRGYLSGPWFAAPQLDPSQLVGFDGEYGLNAVKLFDQHGRQVWHSRYGLQGDSLARSDATLQASLQLLRTHTQQGGHAVVVSEGQQDVVKGIAALRDPVTAEIIGFILAEVRFETQILAGIETIISDFANLEPGAQLIRLSHLILMLVVTLLIVFSAIWLGFYVARTITGPLQRLAGATREVALGNYDVTLQLVADDETGQLIQAFNHMTKDLREHEAKTQKAQFFLQKSNEELERRRQYMEIVLKDITAGVIAVDPAERVTSINAAAQQLLRLEGLNLTGQPLAMGFGSLLYGAFWQPIVDGLEQRKSFRLQIDLSRVGRDAAFIVNASRIYDNEMEMGLVVVFDDAREQARAQRAAAWQRIAHDIKNPITPIKLNAQRLLRRFHRQLPPEDGHVFRDCVEIIVEQVDTLRDLVDEFSRISQLSDLQLRRALLEPILEDVARFFRLSYPGLEIVWKCREPTPVLALNSEQLNRAFMNIFTNAVAAIPAERPGKITLGCTYLESTQVVRVEIADNGCGIPEALQGRVLEPYVSTKPEGTGLGLAIVNQIIREHGGSLRITNHAHQGTLVLIEFPVPVAVEHQTPVAVDPKEL